ncbi:hypothetical protein F4809DRAFT_275476 [Biscogniauxia mediterranea]|nr:hypothetical protein F4809DRAFT_275476 [Biscogniauxia mediterranea]
MASRIPPLLEPYLGLPPEASLILLTGVLGSTTNWLVQRYLYTLLASPPSTGAVPGQGRVGEAGDVNVILVSFLRDYAFWKDGAGRLGLDLDLSIRKGRFIFVDGLSDLFSTSSPGQRPKSPGIAGEGRRSLSSATTQGLRKELEDAIAQVQAASPERQTVLVIDQPDLLLAASGDNVLGNTLQDTLLDLREKVHSAIVTLSADEPLIAPQATPLEKEHAEFVLSLAHDAYLVISLRLLDTGTARDVSGVLRATPGGQSYDSSRNVDEQELLYFVGGDGAVRVFERGQ